MKRIGRYEVLAELGQGAMGVVYRCLDPHIGREIAVKTIRMADAADPGLRARQRERLFREARSAGILSHPFIVTVYDINEEDGEAYIAMELVRGRSLEALLAAGETLSGADLLRVLRQTAEGLDYAHRQGIIHRDIKPANIMVTDGGQAKITDFGIAKIADLERMTVSGLIMGTPNYMAPEQVQGKPVTGQADQYSLAVIAYELMTGERPFVAEQLPTLVYKIVCEEPVPPQRLNPSLGGGIDAVLRRGLAKAPGDRYASCGAFLDALEQACQATPDWKGLPRGGSFALPTQSDTGPAPAVALPAAVATPAAAASETPIVLPPPPPKVYVAEEPRRRAPALLFLTLAAVAGGGYWAWQSDLLPLGPEPELPVASPVERVSSETLTPVAVPGEPAAPEEAPAVVETDAPLGAEPKPKPAAASAQEPAAPPPAPAKPAVLAKPVPETRRAVTKPEPVRTPPPPPASEPVVVWRDVRVRTDPPGARVVIDNLAGTACRAPCSFKADRGNHFVSAVLSGYQEARRSFYVADEPVDLLITLTPSGGAATPPGAAGTVRNGQATVFVQSIPSGAALTVNGKPWPQPTPATLTLPPGDHRLALEKDGARAEYSLRLQAGDVKQISLTLAR